MGSSGPGLRSHLLRLFRLGFDIVHPLLIPGLLLADCIPSPTDYSTPYQWTSSPDSWHLGPPSSILDHPFELSSCKESLVNNNTCNESTGETIVVSVKRIRRDLHMEGVRYLSGTFHGFVASFSYSTGPRLKQKALSSPCRTVSIPIPPDGRNLAISRLIACGCKTVSASIVKNIPVLTCSSPRFRAWAFPPCSASTIFMFGPLISFRILTVSSVEPSSTTIISMSAGYSNLSIAVNV